jgi:GT2 family glycosyltransferase/predicted SAM-dependent methyltransferase
MSQIAVVIPTWNNNEYLIPCLNSLLAPVVTEDLYKIYVVNNGDPRNMDAIQHPGVTILQQKDNLGWEGGLKKGIEASTEEFIVFMNDDTYIPPFAVRWANVLINDFAHPSIGAVGPSSNCVMGAQNIFSGIPYSRDILNVNFLIGFCMMVRRSALVAAGGVDDTLPGGDDLDLSIRLRKAGYHLLIDRNTFVYHHGFKTGERVKGNSSVQGGWNSIQMLERTNWALIKKHGLHEFLWCMNQIPNMTIQPQLGWNNDIEGEVCRKYVLGDAVVELGCGNKKTVPHSVGVDRVANGEQVPGTVKNFISKADIVANVEETLPIESEQFDTGIARHILEHVIDPVAAVREWGRILKHGGRLIIAVPNHDLRNSIPLNIEHVHGWTPRSLQNFMESQGWKTVDMLDPGNNISLVGVFQKNGVH